MGQFQRVCIKVLILSSRIFLRTCGVGLLFVYFGLFGCITYSFFKDIIPSYMKDSHPLIVLIATVLFSAFATGSVFNYLSATFSSPGYTKDYQHCLLRGEGGLLPHCNTCNLPKPHNAHHCSFCNRCILNLDHHCPWINNCVGFNNMRFFLLFLLYSFLACFVYFSFAFPIIFKEDFSLNTIEITYFLAVVLSCTLTIALFFFNIWSWYLAITDQQFIDVLKSRNRDTEEEVETKPMVWKREVLQRRLFEVFGTDNVVLAFLPSTRKLKVNPISCEIEDAELLSYGQA